MALKNKYGEWACVLGAAQGLGAAFSEGLAKRGFKMILVDIDKNTLKTTSEKIRKSSNTEIIESICDLNSPENISKVLDIISNKECRFLVYNAAYGPVKPFLSNTQTELDIYINVNINSTLHLVHRFIDLFQGKSAGIMLLSSLAGFRGTQLVVPYAATKAFLWNFAEGLYYEFKDQPLDVSVCVAGATDTPNFRSTNPKKGLFSPKAMPPKQVAEEALTLFGKKLFIVPGFANKFAHFLLNRVLPRKWASTIHNNTMKNMYS